MAANFCFNFEISEKNSDISTKDEPAELEKDNELTKSKAEFLNASSEELKVIFKENYETQNVEITGCKNGQKDVSCRLTHLSEPYVENLMRNSEEYSSSASLQALESNTDLIPSLYEGGMKIWECSLDLVSHLNQLCLDNKVNLNGKKVLELGSGGGFPGIYAWLKGATVYFQDYNPEVLKLFTIPNMALNANSENPAIGLEDVESCKFISGDWENMTSLLEPMSFDIILTSETIYNANVQKSLYELIKFAVKSTGVVFVAAKSYYFGVGGSTEQFVELVKRDGVFNISKVATFSDGVRREILLMERKGACN